MPVFITLSPEERATNSLSAETLKTAVQLVQMNGCVIFERVLEREFVTELHRQFLCVFENYVGRTDPNRGANRYQMHLPFVAPFNDARIIASPFVLPILDALLGQDAVCHYFASDTPLPGSDYQRVHSDINLLFPETSLSL